MATTTRLAVVDILARISALDRWEDACSVPDTVVPENSPYLVGLFVHPTRRLFESEIIHHVVIGVGRLDFCPDEPAPTHCDELTHDHPDELHDSDDDRHEKATDQLCLTLLESKLDVPDQTKLTIFVDQPPIGDRTDNSPGAYFSLPLPSDDLPLKDSEELTSPSDPSGPSHDPSWIGDQPYPSPLPLEHLASLPDSREPPDPDMIPPTPKLRPATLPPEDTAHTAASPAGILQPDTQGDGPDAQATMGRLSSMSLMAAVTASAAGM